MTAQEALFLTDVLRTRLERAERQRDALQALVTRSYRDGYNAGWRRGKRGQPLERDTRRGRPALHEAAVRA